MNSPSSETVISNTASGYPKDENLTLYDGYLPQGLFEAQRGKEVFLIFSHQSTGGMSLRGRRHSSYPNNKKKYHLRIIDEYYA